MKSLYLSVQKSSVLAEVAKTTAYVGAKTAGPDGANIYDTVFTTNDDAVMLERFFREAKSALTGALKRWITGITETPADAQANPAEVFGITLIVTNRFEEALASSLNAEVFTFFVNYITAQWFAFTNRSDVEWYRGRVADNLREIQQKICFKNKPLCER